MWTAPAGAGAPYRTHALASPPGTYLVGPDDGKPHPGVLALHGSEGGLGGYLDLEAKSIAENGYYVMVPCYAGCSHEPSVMIQDIELSKLAEALAWLKKSPLVGGKKVALYGVSRGAEAAMLLAVLSATQGTPRPDALALHAPTDVVVGGIYIYWVPSHYFGNTQVPEKFERREVFRTPDGKAMNAWIWKSSRAGLEEGKRIELEKYVGPVFITHGEHDPLWGVQRTRRIEETLKKAGRRPVVRYFAGQGHVFTGPAILERQKELTRFLETSLR